MATTKKVGILAQELDKLENDRLIAKGQRDLKAQITIKSVGVDDIVISMNHALFYDGLIHMLDTSIEQVKKEIQEVMFPTKESANG